VIPRGSDAEGHPIKEFRIAEVPWQGAPLFVLWTIDEDGVWVFPGASRTREDMRTLGRIISVTGSMWHPQFPVLLAQVQSEGHVDLIELTDDDQDALNAELAGRLTPRGEA
jgi:hypothetical protein